MTKIFSTIVSIFIIAGMITGLYNPCVAPFAPQEITFPAYDGETITLIEGGASDYGIVIAVGADPAEMMAANKLQDFLKEISGVALPIGDDDGGFAKRISIGMDEALGPEGFHIEAVGDDIVIAGGGPRGVLYAVYDFLEKFLGCRWLNKDMKYIPRLDTVAVPAEIDELETPAFEYRECTTMQGAWDVDSALANRVNAGWSVQELNTPEYGGLSRYVMTGHAGEQIMSEVLEDGRTITMSSPEYFARHADLFAKDINGNPVGGYSNPCFSNPEVLQIYIDYVKARMEADPATEFLSIALNDTDNTCQCLACRTAYFEECGIPMDTVGKNCSGSHFRFLNQLCEAVVPLYPNLMITTFAYFNTELPPKTRLHPNAVVYFCPIFMCYVHKAGECTQEETRETFDGNYKTWVETCDNLAIFEYPLAYNHWNAVYPIWDNIQSYLQMYRDDGVAGLLNCSSEREDLSFCQLKGYLYARLLWNPDADMEDLYNAFLPLYYGEGWQYIREYLRVTSEELTGRTIGSVQYHTNCLSGGTPIGDLAATNNEVKYVDRLWEKAKELTAASAYPQKDAQLRNIRMAELSWRSWKGDNFRGEFWLLSIPATRQKSNTQLFNDIKELGVSMHNEDSAYVSAEDFEKLQLKLLTPRYWCWRAIGRENEGKLDNFWQVLWAIIN